MTSAAGCSARQPDLPVTRHKVAVGDVQADVLEGMDLGRALEVGFGDALEDDEGGRRFLGPGAICGILQGCWHDHLLTKFLLYTILCEWISVQASFSGKLCI